MTYKKLRFLPLIILVMGLLSAPGIAAAPIQASDQTYIFQADDQLTHLAEKYFGAPQTYPAIIQATNNRASQDETYNLIDDENRILVGQKLLIPALDEDLLAEMVQNNATPTAEQQQLLDTLKAWDVPPELQNEVWLNSDPLKLADLHGKVVIIEFWTYG